MKTIFNQQAEFLSAGDIPFPTERNVPIARELIYEEFDEFTEESAYTCTRNINDLKECIDIIYVCAQYMNEAVGSDKAQQIFEAVHAHNMSKCTDGKLVKNAQGKVLKPEGFDKNSVINVIKTILEKD